MVKTTDIACVGYSVKADIYEGAADGPVLLSLIGRTSKRTKQRYFEFLPRLAKELGITTVIFDYTGHGDSPFEFDELRPAQHALETVTVFDWMREQYPGRQVFVVGSSYGGYMALHLSRQRNFDGLVLRAPALYNFHDFYTKAKDEDKDATHALRADAAALAGYPLFKLPAVFTGKTMLLVHDRDETVLKPSTDAYAKAFNAEVIVKDVTHSLDDSTPEQIADYNQAVFDWLKAHIVKR